MTGDSTWLRYDAPRRRVTLTLHVQPGAKKNQTAGFHGGALKIRVAAPAADNKANAALIVFLAERLGISKSSISIRHGATSRRKAIEISGGPELARAIEQLLAEI